MYSSSFSFHKIYGQWLFGLGWLGVLASSVLGMVSAKASETGPQSFLFQGILQNSNTQLALLDSSVGFVIEILDPNASCVLYSEQQTGVNLADTNGYFSLQVGSAVGSAKRVAGVDLGLSMSEVFANPPSSSVVTLGGSDSCMAGYTPAAGDIRLMKVTVTSVSIGTLVLGPMQIINTSPSSFTADTLQGFDPSQFLQINSNTQLNQNNLEEVFSTNNFSKLIDLVEGNSNLYMPLSPNGLQLPQLNSAPISPVAGQLWFDANQRVLDFYDGSVINSLGINSNPGTVTEVVAGSGLAGGNITINGTLSLAASGVTAGTYGDANHVPSFTVDTYGRITNANALPLTLAPSGVSAGTYGSGSTVAVVTVGEDGRITSASSIPITISNLGSGFISSTQANPNTVALRDANGFVAFSSVALVNSNNYTVTLAPSGNTMVNYQLTLPASPGSANDFLLSNANGVMSWFAPVLNFNAVAPLYITGNANTPMINMTVASSNSNGYLLASDFNSFMGKVAGASNLNSNNALLITASAGTATQANGLSINNANGSMTLLVQAGISQGNVSLTTWKSSNGNVLYTVNASGSPNALTDLVTLAYANTTLIGQNSNYLPLTGGTMSGPINMGNFAINHLATPQQPNDAATKAYVDAMGQVAGGDLTGTYPNPTVASLDGIVVNSNVLASGTFMKYITNQYKLEHLYIADIVSSTTSGQFFPLTCNTNQTMVYDGTQDLMQCSTIDVTGATGVLAVGSGGTGLATLAANQLLLGNGNAALAQVPNGASGYVLTANGGSLAPTFAPINLSSVASLTGTLPVSFGGSGSTSLTANQLIIGNGNQPFGSLANGITGSVLLSAGNGNVPMFGALSLSNANAVTNVLPVSFGGSGQANFLSYSLLMGNGNGAVATIAPSSANLFLMSNGNAASPNYSTINLSNSASFSGSLPIALGGTGTTSFNSNQLLVGGSSYLNQVTNGNTGMVLVAGSAGAMPQFSTLNLAQTTAFSNALQVTNGGTGNSNFTSNQLLIGNGNSAVGTLSNGSSGTVLLSQGNGNAPVFGSLALGSLGGGSGVLGLSNGGTGSSSFNANSLLVSGSSSLGTISNGAAGTFLMSNGSTSAPSFGLVPLGSPNSVSGVLGLANGGTGSSSLVANQLLYTAATTVSSLSNGSSGAVLLSNGAGVPAFGQLSLSNSNAVSGILPVSNGGTGVSSLTSYELLVGSGSSPVSFVTNGSTGSLLVGQSGSAPVFGSISLSTGGNVSFTGTLPVTFGGTGLTTLTANQLLLGNGSSALSSVSGGATNAVLVSAGSSGSPSFTTMSLANANAVSGILPIVNGGTGGSTAAAAMLNLTGISTLGDLAYYGASGPTRLAGNTNTQTALLTSTGTGTTANAPAWSYAPSLLGNNITNINPSNFVAGTGNITLQTAAGNYNIFLTPTGTGMVQIMSGGLNMNNTSIYNQVLSINNQNAAYTLASTDTGNLVAMNVSDSNGVTYVTLPATMPVGYNVMVSQDGNDTVTFSPATGATMYNRQGYTSTGGQYAVVSLIVIANSGGSAATYLLAGDTSP